MISTSFYLLTPEATSQSQLYISISNKTNRLRFATGESFLTSYCNIRKRKGRKELVKKGSPFYFDYTTKLTQIRDNLHRIEIDLSKERKCSLEAIRDTYYKQTGKLKDESLVTFTEAWEHFLSSNQSNWTANTRKKIDATFNHLREYENNYGELTTEAMTEEFWNNLRDKYFVADKKFSNNSTNKYLTIVKQFLLASKKKGYIKHENYFDDLSYLKELSETFKIALKEHEIEKLITMDLSSEPRLDRVRDLFALEILTGQRFSDLPKLLDAKHVSETNIQIYQEKTNERVTIPLHPKLKKHLAHIFKKYPDGLPIISNQKFNEFIKEICELAGFDKQHSWVTLCGKQKVNHSDFRYNLVSSHTGRRTFCTLALKDKINPTDIMKVTGHRKFEQFLEYVKVDDEDLELAFEGFINGNN